MMTEKIWVQKLPFCYLQQEQQWCRQHGGGEEHGTNYCYCFQHLIIFFDFSLWITSVVVSSHFNQSLLGIKLTTIRYYN